MSASIWNPGTTPLNVDAESSNLSQVFTLSAGQTLLTLSSFSYTPGSGSIAVYRNGQKLILGTDFLESSGTTVTLTFDTADAGEKLEVCGIIGSSAVNAQAAAVSAAEAAASEANAAASAASIALAEGETLVKQEDTLVGAARLPVGTTAQRPTGSLGRLRYNSTLNQFEGYGASGWGTIGGGSGATGGGTDKVFVETDQTITTNYTLTASKNAMTAGPVTIADGATVTVPTGATWTIV